MPALSPKLAFHDVSFYAQLSFKYVNEGVLVLLFFSFSFFLLFESSF